MISSSASPPLAEAVGWHIDLGVELHRNMSAGNAVLLCAELARFRPLFVEDPIPPDSVSAFRAFAAKVGVPVAAGERNTTMWEFAEYLERPGVDFVRPDVGIAGGITHVKKICALAEAFHADILPHAVPSGPVAVAAHVQLGMCTPNWELQEHRPQAAAWTDLVDEVIPVRDGYLVPPDRPGLGISLDDACAWPNTRHAAPTSRTPRCAKTTRWRSDERQPPEGRTRLQRADLPHLH